MVQLIKKQKQNIGYGVLMLLFSIIFVAPLLKTQTFFASDDLAFHINRLQDLVSNYKHGNWYPYLYTFNFFKVPYLLGTFYPQLLLLPFVWFTALTGNLIFGVYLGITLYTYLTMLIMFGVVKKVNGSSNQLAFVAAVLYAFSILRTYNVYSRFALGEFVAMTFIPLALYGLYQLVKNNGRGWLALGLGLSMVMCSHVITTFLTIIFLLIEACFLVPAVKNWKLVWLNLGKAVVVFIGSSAIFLGPFLEQSVNIHLAQPAPMNILATALPFANLVENSLSNNLVSSYMLGNPVSGTGIGLIYLLAIGYGMINFKKFSRFEQVIYLLGTVAFLMSSQLFPWNLLQKTPIKVIQFATRLLPFATVYLSVIAAQMVLKVSKQLSFGQQKVVLLLASLMIIIPWYGSLQKFQQVMTGRNDNFTVEKRYQSSDYNEDYYHLKDYVPVSLGKGVDNLEGRQAIINGKHVKLKKITAVPDGMKYREQNLQNATKIILPAVAYANLVAYQQGTQLPISNEDGQVALKNTKRGSILLKYEPSLLDKASMAISLVTWLVLFLFGVRTLLVKGLRKK